MTTDKDYAKAWCTCTQQDVRIGCPIHDGPTVHGEPRQRAQSTTPVSHTTSALDEATNVANLALAYPDLMPETRAALAELVKVSRRLSEAVDRLVQGLGASESGAE